MSLVKFAILKMAFMRLLDMLVNYFAINLFYFGHFRDAPIFTIDCILMSIYERAQFNIAQGERLS